MKKKWIILICALVIVVVTIVTLCFTLFTVQTVEVDFRSSVSREYDAQQIIEKSNIKKGKNIFFLKKNDFANNIEKAFPYLEVINIETHFPSKLTIHLKERVALYAIKSGEAYLFIDANQKILEKRADFSPSRTSPIFVDVDLPENELEKQEGEFLNLPGLSEFYNALLLNGKNLSDGLSLVKQISYFQSENVVYHDKELGLKLTLNSGREVYLHNFSYGLEYKLAKFFAVEEILPELKDMLSDEQIVGSEIHIENYLGAEFTQKDSFYYLVYNGERINPPEG